MPPQSTTTSHSTAPRSVRTPVTRPPRVVIAVARVRCAITAPAVRAEAASDAHSRAGSTWPSVGVYAAPSTPSVDIGGNSARASSAEISSSGRPARRAHAAWRRISASRGGDDARRSDPDSTHPGARSPPASSSRRYSAADQPFIRVRAGSARSCPTSPAEWNVDPLVSSARSRSSTSRSPRSVRWCATLAPPTPPPTITIRAREGSALGRPRPPP